MTTDQLIALAIFAAVSSVTPGPNNLMLLASGVNHGVRRSLPHLAGVTLGFVFLFLCLGFGLQRVFVLYPQLEVVLRYVGAAYLVWLAWKLAHSAPPIATTASANTDLAKQQGTATSKPMSFASAVAFQWVNPKAIMMAIGAISTYVPSGAGAWGMLLVGLVFGVINAPMVTCWLLFGSSMRQFLQDPQKRQWFNWIMAALLLATLYPVFAPLLLRHS
ncbi:MAG TPA: LysE family translocator [Burkholderiaceae bacterium]|nr:LysE family translocator [Burkholderiaceae bacterium]